MFKSKNTSWDDYYSNLDNDDFEDLDPLSDLDEDRGED